MTCLGSGSESEWGLESGTQGLLFCCWVIHKKRKLGNCLKSVCYSWCWVSASLISVPGALRSWSTNTLSAHMLGMPQRAPTGAVKRIPLCWWMYRVILNSVWVQYGRRIGRTPFPSNFLISVATALQLGKGAGIFFFILVLFSFSFLFLVFF